MNLIRTETIPANPRQFLLCPSTTDMNHPATEFQLSIAMDPTQRS